MEHEHKAEYNYNNNNNIKLLSKLNVQMKET